MYIIHTLVPGVHDQKEITCTHRLRKLPRRFIFFFFSFYSRRFTPYYKTLHNELTQLAMHIRLLLSTKTVRYILPWVPEDFLPRLIVCGKDNIMIIKLIMLMMMMKMITMVMTVSFTAFIISLQFYFLFCHLFPIFSSLFFAQICVMQGCSHLHGFGNKDNNYIFISFFFLTVILQGLPSPESEKNAVEVVIQYAIEKLGFPADKIIIYAWSIGKPFWPSEYLRQLIYLPTE